MHFSLSKYFMFNHKRTLDTVQQKCLTNCKIKVVGKYK